MEKFKFITLPVRYVKYKQQDADDELTYRVLADIGKANDKPEIENELIMNTSFNVYDLISGIQLRPAVDEELNIPVYNKTTLTSYIGEMEIDMTVEEVINLINEQLK